MRKKILLFVTLLSCFCLTIFNQTNSSKLFNDVSAEETPAYFIVKTSDDEIIHNNTCVKLTKSKDVTISFNSDKTINITSISPQIKLNNKDLLKSEIDKMIKAPTDYKIDTEETESFMFKISGEKIFDKLNKREDGSNLYGKFDIKIDYYIFDNGNILNTINFTFYLVNYNDYIVPVIENTIITSAGNLVYNNIYEYRYLDFDLPTLTYNAKSFDIDISKRVGNSLVETSSIMLRKENNEDVIKITKNLKDLYITKNSDGFVTIVFNSLCEYEITYKEILNVGNDVEILCNYENTQNTLIDKLTIKGFNLFHADMSNPLNKKEFVNIDSKGKILERTDYSYLVNNIKPNITFDDVLNISTTNQGPVQIIGNVALNKAESLVWFNDEEPKPITNNFFLNPGKYILKLVSEDYTQWFVFEITSKTQSFLMGATLETNIETLEGVDIISSGDYTNKNVVVSYKQKPSPFDAKTTLKVSQFNYQKSLIKTFIVKPDKPTVFTENGYYEVELVNHDNLTGSKGNFYIDKDEIKDYSLYTLAKNFNGKYYKKEDVKFLTNSKIALSFGYKSSGARVTCEYKYFPMETIMGEYLDIFNSNYDLESFYEAFDENDFSIPVAYKIKYKLDALALPYAQANNIANVNESSILSKAGLYVFCLTDDAGNKQYFSACIDYSSPVVLQKRQDGHFEKINDLNIVSEDTILYFGKNKILEMVDFNFESEDAWIKTIATSYKDNFKKFNYAGNIKTYLNVPINPNMYFSIGGAKYEPYILNKENFYSYTIKALIDGKENENQYTFFVRDNSNTKVGDTEVQSYVKYYSTRYNIRISFDASKLAIYYRDDNDKKIQLSLNNFNTIENTTKKQYFNPTNQNTFYNDENVMISFITKPYEGVIEVEEVNIMYYPFEYRKHDADNYYIYDYAKTPANTFVVYKYDFENNNISVDLTTGVGDERTFKVNSVKDYLDNKYKTMEGKYVLTRKYHNFATTSQEVSNKHDYETRIQTFYIDKKSIITMPEMVDKNNMVSLVGGAIKLKITNEFFNEIYLSQNYNNSNDYDGSHINILETNKLPVKLFIPSVKYASPTLGTEPYKSDANYFDPSLKKESLIDFYTLSAKVVKYSKDSNLQNDENGEVIYNGNTTTNFGYLDIPELKQNGIYKVTISQNDPTSKDFIFVFKIIYSEPSFTLETEEGIPLNIFINERMYYTNRDSFKVRWRDDDNPYKAKIEKNEMKYTLYYDDDRVITKKLNVPNYNPDEKEHFAIVDISKEIDYNQIVKIDVSAQFDGEESNFPAGYFKTIKTIKIDKIAPKENIDTLLKKSGLIDIKDKIRDDSNGIHNISKKDGDYKYFSFAVDANELFNLIKINKNSGEEAYNIWVRHRPFKYDESYYQETDPNEFIAGSGIYKSLSENDLRVFSQGFNTYYEFIEKDLAGNLTIYSVYLTNNEKEKEDSPLITWKSDVVNKQETLFKNDLSKEVSIYAKGSFAIKDICLYKNYGFKNSHYEIPENHGYPWYYLMINGVRYYHTPYLEDNVLSDGEFTYNISELTSFKVNEQMQTFTLYNVPNFTNIKFNIGVLNTDNVLNYVHFSQSNIFFDEETEEYVFYDVDNNELFRAKEGIIIEIPNNKENMASIFASSLKIREYRHYGDGFKENLIYDIKQDLISAESLETLPQSTAVSVKTFNSQDKLFAVFYVNKPIRNQYYIYSISDNFGENYDETVIYGEEIADESWKSSVPIKKIINDDINYYYSTDTMYFNFNSVKNYIEFKVNGVVYSTKNPEQLKILEGANDIGVKVSKINDSSIYRVEIIAPNKTMAQNGQFGDLRRVELSIHINLETGLDTESSKIESKKFVAEIYNVIPKINLFDKNNNNVNDIFSDHSMIVGYPITVKFADTSLNLYKNIVYLKNNNNGNIIEIESGFVIQEVGDYSLIIGYDKSSIYSDENYYTYLDFKVHDSSVDFYEVYILKDGKRQVVKETGTSYTLKYVTSTDEEKKETIIYSHYIVNSPAFITCNEAQKITYKKFAPSVLDGNIKTDVFKISNATASADNTNINYFEKLIAITFVPETSIILNKLTNENAQNDVLYDSNDSKKVYSRTFKIKKDEESNGVLKLSWNSYYGIKENTVNLILYDDLGNVLTPKIETKNNISYVYIDKSGYYNMSFVDNAGNIQYFGANTKFKISFVSSVLFNINGEKPINNAIYNDKVEITIPNKSLSLYDNSAVPKLTIYKNGELLNLNSSYNTSYTFTDSGFYKLKFSAKVAGDELREEEYYFTIVNPNETRWAFEFQEYGSYYIEKIVKNGFDITERLSNASIGKVVEIQTDKDKPSKKYLKNILLSLYDEQTGPGRYTLTIKTNDINNASFDFSFWIHDAKPPIHVSVDEGTKTFNEITVTFNIFNLYDEVKDCKISITGLNDIIVNENYVNTHKENNGIKTIKLKTPRTYYIQVYSEGGNLLYSYRVDIKERLNTVSIILIVVGCLVVIALIVFFIVLRKRVRIR